MLADFERFFKGIISVSPNEVLQKKLRVCEIAGIIFERLSMASHESFLKVSSVPDPSLHVLALEEMFSFSNELVGPHLDVLIKEVASKNLLSVLGIKSLRMKECVSKYGLRNELEVLVMEENIVVVEE